MDIAIVFYVIIGIVVAIVFALLSYFYWWGAVLVVAGSPGFWLAHWLLVGRAGSGWRPGEWPPRRGSSPSSR